MRFAVATKHLHLAVSYREADEEEEGIHVTLDGDMSLAPGPDVLPTGDVPDDLHFGFLRG